MTESTILNDVVVDTLTVLSEIVLDEYSVVDPSNELYPKYFEFINYLKYDSKWFGLRHKYDIVRIWSRLRDGDVEVSESMDLTPSVSITLLSNITQRLVLVTDPSLWEPNSVLFNHIARVINIYDSETLSEGDVSDVYYDAAISSTLTHEQIVNILSNNKWLVVAILLNWIPNDVVMRAIGYVEQTR